MSPDQIVYAFLYRDHPNSLWANPELSPQDLAELYNGEDVTVLIVAPSGLTLLMYEEGSEGIYSRALDVGQVLQADIYWVFSWDLMGEKFSTLMAEIGRK